MIRHQSAMVTSPSAMACMIKVEACEPLLPPLEMIKGIKVASITTLAISVLEMLHSRDGDQFTKKKNNQPDDSFFIKSEKRHFKIGLFQGRSTTHLLHVLTEFFTRYPQHIINGNNT